MKIDGMIKDEKRTILNALNELTPVNCIEFFNSYLDMASDQIESKYERGYISFIETKLNDFAKDVLRRKFSKVTQEKQLYYLVDAYMEGPYAFQSYWDNRELGEFFKYNIEDANERTDLIKAFMLDCLVQYEASLTASKKAVQIEKLLREKACNEKRIKESQQRLKELETKINELQEER